MAVQLWTAPLGPLQGINGAAYVSSSTITDVSPGGLANPIELPGSTMMVGTRITIDAFGTFSNTGTPTLVLGLYYGGVAGIALAASSAVTTTTAAVGWTWQMHYQGVVQATGTSGKILGSGWVRFPTALTTFAERTIPETTPAQVTIDTTVQKAITVGATWGTLSASNTLTCMDLLVVTHG